ncbi:uncharacterized protein LOC122499714 [Leptopilina heterotoma]|uniref:uncharacterized protein LOC122499714 n=1 Tax=Leptopilina heterotoma TaxID=63436 RepID=UPI001CA82755|nr:uncharacterized protein LOC122499714 [Leptopilina heterotoma]
MSQHSDSNPGDIQDRNNEQRPGGGPPGNAVLNGTMNPAGADASSAIDRLTLRTSACDIPIFDGKTPPLRDFVQAVKRAGIFITDVAEPEYIRAVLSRLDGQAYASLTIKQKQTEIAHDYHDRLQDLINGARHALKPKYNKLFREITNDERDIRRRECDIILQPIRDCALDAFVKGLPTEISKFVDARNPHNMEEALEYALHAEERENYSERPRSTSYHINKIEERPRPPSPYSKQLEQHNSGGKRRPDPGREPASHASSSSHHRSSDVLHLTPEQLGQFYRRDSEPDPPASEECTVRREHCRFSTTGAAAQDSPVVLLQAPEFKHDKVQFLVDPGSDSNLVKLCVLNPELTLVKDKCIEISGITNHVVTTLGTVSLTISSNPVEFHVVRDSFPISTHGILGRPYLRKEQAQISFRHNTLVTVSNPVTPIPFIDKESLEARKALRSEIKPFTRILRIQSRTRTPVAIDVITSDLKQGYLPRIETPTGLYLGEAIVTNNNGVCHAMVINTTEEDINVRIPPQELIPFDFCKFPGEEPTDSENDTPDPGQCPTYADRVIKVKNALFLNHLAPDDHNKVIHKKQYRSPFEALDQIDVQLKKQFDSGIIGHSNSPYNAPLLIVPKKMDASGEKKWRVVVDYRALNDSIIGDAFPLPSIN